MRPQTLDTPTNRIQALEALPGRREPLLALLRLLLRAGRHERATALAADAVAGPWEHGDDYEVLELYGDALR